MDQYGQMGVASKQSWKDYSACMTAVTKLHNAGASLNYSSISLTVILHLSRFIRQERVNEES